MNFLSSRDTGPKSARGSGRQRPSRPGSRDAWPARRGPVACLRSPRASKAGPSAAPARRLGRVGLARQPAVLTQCSTVARPTASAHWLDDRKVLPHGIAAHPCTGPQENAGGRASEYDGDAEVNLTGARRLRWSGKSATPQEASLRWVGVLWDLHTRTGGE
jgi:hypothetical protein